VNYNTAILRTNLCDNNPVCQVISECNNEAVFFDLKTNTVCIDEDKCIACGICKIHCSLFVIVHSESDYLYTKENIRKDPRKQSDLQVERFSADVVDKYYLINEVGFQESINTFTKSINGLSFVEIVLKKQNECLYNSIPVSDIIGGLHLYRKIVVENVDDEFIRKAIGFDNYPVILVYNNGELKEKIYSVFKESDNKKQLINQIKQIQTKYGVK